MFGLWGSKRRQVTPQQIGYVVGAGLQQAFVNKPLTQDEMAWLTTIKLGHHLYQREVICLVGSAGAWAIVALLDNSPHEQDVRRGYLDSWRQFGGASEENGRTAAALGLRAAEYATAAAAQMMKDADALGNDIVDKFGDYLAAAKGIDVTAPPSNADATTLAHIRLLASLSASAYFWSAFDAAAKEFADAGLIQRAR